MLKLKDAFPAAGPLGYHDNLEELRAYKASGVYAILKGRQVLYVGESHTGRLYDTITRHFREWRPFHDPQGRRRGGTMYRRQDVRVIYCVTPADQAQQLQYEEIQRLRPKDNTLDGASVIGADDAAPF